MSVLDQVRVDCAAVAAQARHVGLDGDRLESYGAELMAVPAPAFDPGWHWVGRGAESIAYVLVLDTVNFGSGWGPDLALRSGSIYVDVATAIRRRFETAGPPTAEELAALDAAGAAALTGLDAPDLTGHFARALNELGALVRDRFGGAFPALVDSAKGSAAALVALLAGLPSFADIADYRGRRVHLLKRAQITAADLTLAVPEVRFRDRDRLTAFADNVLPRVLVHDGVLTLAPELAARIAAGVELAPGSSEEVELRALSIHAVERLSRLTDEPAWRLDHRLWHRGHEPAYRHHPTHRTHTVYY